MSISIAFARTVWSVAQNCFGERYCTFAWLAKMRLMCLIHWDLMTRKALTTAPLMLEHGGVNTPYRHYDDVIMTARASQITSLTIVYSTVYSGAHQRKHQGSASLAFCAGNSPWTGEFRAQMASNAENVSIWWRHHENYGCNYKSIP